MGYAIYNYQTVSKSRLIPDTVTDVNAQIYYIWISNCKDSIDGVMVNMLASSAVDGRVKPKTMKSVFSASPLSMQYQGVRAKTAQHHDNVSEWSDMSTVISVSKNCKDPTKCIGLVQSWQSLSSYRM